MADATTANATLKFKVEKNQSTLVVESSEVVPRNRYSGVKMSTGRLVNADDEVGTINIGIFSRNNKNRAVDSDTGDGSIEWTNDTDLIITDETVAGVTAETDVFSLVFPTDNQTLTLTRPTNGTPNGYVKKFKSSGVADLQLFDEVHALLYAMMGTDKEELTVGMFPSLAIEGTSEVLLCRMKMHGRGNITDFNIDVAFDDTGVVAGDQSIILKIDSTHRGGSAVQVTGAAVDVDDTTAYASGDRLSSTAITANNTYSNNDEVQVFLASGGTGLTASQGSLFVAKIEVQRLPGA